MRKDLEENLRGKAGSSESEPHMKARGLVHEGGFCQCQRGQHRLRVSVLVRIQNIADFLRDHHSYEQHSIIKIAKKKRFSTPGRTDLLLNRGKLDE